MRRITSLLLLLIAFATTGPLAACGDSTVHCPAEAPARPVEESAFGIIMGGYSGPPTPPLICGYIDSCGDFECTAVSGGWSCVREDDAGCPDSGKK